MTLATYADLKASATDWLKRADMAARLPDFIALAEARINRIARVRTMENELSLSMTVGARFIALPGNFSVPLAVYLESMQPRQVLTPVVPEVLAVSNVAGMPSYWCIDGATLAFERPADQPYPITLRQQGNFKLSDAAPTNAVLTDYPDVYLYGTLYQGFLHTRDVEQATLNKGLYEQAVKEMNQTESRSRAIAPLRTEVAQVIGVRCHDIRRGY